LYAPNQHVTTRNDTHKQQHNRTSRPREGFVPGGPYKTGTRLGTYIATTPAKKKKNISGFYKQKLKKKCFFHTHIVHLDIIKVFLFTKHAFHIP
jgi:hypothetical protein